MRNYTDYIVNIKQLKLNICNIKKICGEGVKFCAIVKANAYGLGAMHLCKNITGLVDFFAVATLQEALSIRIYDKSTPILVLGVVSSDYVDICSYNDISISVGSYAQLREYAKVVKQKLKIHLQINTGLNRYGFRSIVEFKKALKFIEKSEYIIHEGLYSHFATKSNDTLFINKQYYKFIQFKNCVKDGVICHIANSFATIYDSRYRLDMVRCGMLMYGGYDQGINNKCILNIKSKVIAINNIKRGDSVGYDRTFVAKKNMVIGVVPVGYADGLDRHLSNKFEVLIGGKKCRIVGNICMDVFMVDLTNVTASIGDEVVLLGRQCKEEIKLQNYADILNTSIYEVLLKFNHRRMNYIVIK